MDTSNVISTEHNLIVQRGADLEVYYQAKDADGNPIDWNTVLRVQADVKNARGVVVSSYLLDDGIYIDDQDSTILFLRKRADEKNIPAGRYQWDMKVEFSEEVAQYPVRGYYMSVDYITA